jgi:hypothetical protein
VVKLPSGLSAGHPENGVAGSYEYMADVATWVNKGSAQQGEFQVIAPLTWGFDRNGLAPLLPENLDASGIGDDISVSWSSAVGDATHPEVDHYELALAPGDIADTPARSEISKQYRVVASDVRGSEFTVAGLTPGQEYSFIIRSVAKDGRVSAWSRHVTGITWPDSGFSITKQPSSASAVSGSGFNFEVAVEQGGDQCGVQYEWQHYVGGINSGDSWETIPGASSASYGGTATDSSDPSQIGANGSRYRVMLTKMCSPYPRVYSIPVGLTVTQ